MSLSEFDIQTRYNINRFFVDQGYAPNIHDLAVLQKCPAADIAESFERLSDDHRLLLFPETHDIWVAHPFSAIPSNYWVESGGRGWWGNCGFCSLGIAAMLGGEATVYARLGAQREPIEVRVTSSSIEPPDHFLHIPLPIARWHDNVIYTCSNVHYFHSLDDINQWCETKWLPRGREMKLDRAWKLAKAWYGAYLEPSWRPRSNEDTNRLLKRCGLNSAFWRLPET